MRPPPPPHPNKKKKKKKKKKTFSPTKKNDAAMSVVTRYKNQNTQYNWNRLNSARSDWFIKNLTADSPFNKAWIQNTFSYNLRTTKRLASAAKTT